MPFKAFGDFQITIFILSLLPFYRLMQHAPQAMSSMATRNIRPPTGKMATIRILNPNAKAHSPKKQGPCPHIVPTSFSLSWYQYIQSKEKRYGKSRREIPDGLRIFPCPETYRFSAHSFKGFNSSKSRR